MRCSAKRVTEHKVTFRQKNGFAARNLHLISQLTLTASPQGEAKVRVVPRGQLTNGFCPNTETFSAVHNISVVWLTRLARSLGGLGGRSRIEFIMSPLPRRRHNESHFAAQSPERSFFFPLFLSAEKEKEVIGDAVTKSLSPNQKNRPHRTASIIYPFSKVLRGSGGFFSKNPPAFLIHTLSNLPEPLADYVACRGYHDKSV